MGNTCGQAYALMVMTPVQDGHEADLRAALAALPLGDASPLARLPGTHFARFLVLHDLVWQGPPQVRDSLSRPYLLFTSNLDGDLEDYLTALRVELAAEVDALWGHCVGYPGSADADAFLAYLLHAQVDTSFFFSAYGDATVPQVLAALDLRRRLTEVAVATQDLPPAQLRAAVTAALR